MYIDGHSALTDAMQRQCSPASRKGLRVEPGNVVPPASTMVASAVAMLKSNPERLQGFMDFIRDHPKW